MAVGFEKRGGKARIKFVTDVSHDGVDYGPQYDQQEIEIDARDAANYVRQGRAVYTEAAPKKPEVTSDAQEAARSGMTTESAAPIVTEQSRSAKGKPRTK